MRSKSISGLALLGIAAMALSLLAACGDGAYKNPCGTNSSAREENMAATPENTDNTAARPTGERIHEVRLKYDPLFWRQPNVFGVSEGFFKDENRERTGVKGIIIRVDKKVDQSTLPPEDRIPDCLEGIPAQILEAERQRVPILIEDIDEEETNGSD